jgi:hypothetical protein
MGLTDKLDDLKDNAKEMMDKPENRDKIEQMMKDHGISREEAMQKIKGE